MAYLLKERIGDPRALLEAVKEVASGGTRIDPDVMASLVYSGRSSSRLADLTERERDVLALMADGRTNASVAEDLYLSESTNEKYVSSVFTKLGLSDEDMFHKRVAGVLAYLQDQQSASRSGDQARRDASTRELRSHRRQSVSQRHRRPDRAFDCPLHSRHGHN